MNTREQQQGEAAAVGKGRLNTSTTLEGSSSTNLIMTRSTRTREAVCKLLKEAQLELVSAGGAAAAEDASSCSCISRLVSSLKNEFPFCSKLSASFSARAAGGGGGGVDSASVAGSQSVLRLASSSRVSMESNSLLVSCEDAGAAAAASSSLCSKPIRRSIVKRHPVSASASASMDEKAILNDASSALTGMLDGFSDFLRDTVASIESLSEPASFISPMLFDDDNEDDITEATLTAESSVVLLQSEKGDVSGRRLSESTEHLLRSPQLNNPARYKNVFRVVFRISQEFFAVLREALFPSPSEKATPDSRSLLLQLPGGGTNNSSSSMSASSGGGGGASRPVKASQTLRAVRQEALDYIIAQVTRCSGSQPTTTTAGCAQLKGGDAVVASEFMLRASVPWWLWAFNEVGLTGALADESVASPKVGLGFLASVTDTLARRYVKAQLRECNALDASTYLAFAGVSNGQSATDSLVAPSAGNNNFGPNSGFVSVSVGSQESSQHLVHTSDPDAAGFRLMTASPRVDTVMSTGERKLTRPFLSFADQQQQQQHPQTQSSARYSSPPPSASRNDVSVFSQSMGTNGLLVAGSSVDASAMRSFMRQAHDGHDHDDDDDDEQGDGGSCDHSPMNIYTPRNSRSVSLRESHVRTLFESSMTSGPGISPAVAAENYGGTSHRHAKAGSIANSSEGGGFLPNVAAAEQILSAADKAIHFGVKLGNLYATQDMNALLSLLPMKPLLSSTNYASAAPESNPSFTPADVLSPLEDERGSAGAGAGGGGVRSGAYMTGAASYPSLGDSSSCFDTSKMLSAHFASNYRSSQNSRGSARAEIYMCKLFASTTSASSFGNTEVYNELSFYISLMLFNQVLRWRTQRSNNINSTNGNNRNALTKTVFGLSDSVWCVFSQSFAETCACALIQALNRRHIPATQEIIDTLASLVVIPSLRNQSSVSPLPEKHSSMVIASAPTHTAFLRTWRNGFTQVADTTKHLLSCHHGFAKPFESVTWYLAGLADYVLQICQRWNEDCAPSPQPLTTAAAAAAAGDSADTEQQSTPGSQREYALHRILSQVDESFQDITCFMEYLADVFASEVVLTAVRDGSDQQYNGAHDSDMEYDPADKDENGIGPQIEMAGTARGPGSLLREHRRHVQLCIHYYLEIFDTLIRSTMRLDRRPLFLYPLVIGLSGGEVVDDGWVSRLKTAGGYGAAHRLPESQKRTSRVADVADKDDSLGRLRHLLNAHCSVVVQRAMSANFSLSPEQFSTANMMCSENNNQTATATSAMASPVSEDALLGFMTDKEGPYAAEGNAGCASSSSTMWWPSQSFQHQRHLQRVLEHAQLVTSFLQHKKMKATDTYPDSCERQYERSLRRYRRSEKTSSSLFFSGVSSLLETSSGPCAQLLSLPCARPQILAGGSYCTSPLMREQQQQQRSGRQGPSSPVLSEKNAAVACGGLWLRIQMLHILANATVPMYSTERMRFCRSVKKSIISMTDRSAQRYYGTLSSMIMSTFSVLPGVYSATYVRLLFLRIVQAFYSDRQASESSPSAASPWLAPSSGTAAAASTAAAAGPAATTQQQQVAALWTQYSMELMRTLRVICWHHNEAHHTAITLSIPSVLGKLLLTALEDEKALGGPSSTPRGKAPLASSFFTAAPSILAAGVPDNFVDFEDDDDEDDDNVGNGSFSHQDVGAVPAGTPADASYLSTPQSQVVVGSDTGCVIPKLSLAGLAPPLYYASSGDTGAAQEALLLHKADNEDEAPITWRNAKDDSLENSQQSQVVPIFSPKPSPVTVSPLFNIPKLSLGGLGPPLYFASSGDTGTFMELPPPPPPPQQQHHHQQQSADVNSPSKNQKSEENEPRHAEATTPVKGNMRAIRSKPVSEAGGSSRRDPVNFVSDAAVASAYTPVPSLLAKSSAAANINNIPPLPLSPSAAAGEGDSGVLSPRTGSTKQWPRSASPGQTRAQLQQPMAPKVIAELVLCLSTLVLQRGSGMIRYGFTVSSLTQARAWSVAQPRLLYGGLLDTTERFQNRVSSSGPKRSSSIGGGPTAHGSSSFHVLRALMEYFQERHQKTVDAILLRWLNHHYVDVQSLLTKLHLQHADDGATRRHTDEHCVPFVSGQYVLLRLLLPRRKWLGQFDIHRRLGSGGYGSVVSASLKQSPSIDRGDEKSSAGGRTQRHPQLPLDAVESEALRLYSRLAIKLMPLRMQGSESGTLPTCHAEVLAMYRLRSHPRISTLLSFGCSGTENYFITPEYTGGSLSSWRVNNYPPGCAALTQKVNYKSSGGGTGGSSTTSSFSLFSLCGQLFMQVLEAVEFVHQHRIRHGDIKSDNVFIEAQDEVSGWTTADSKTAQRQQQQQQPQQQTPFVMPRLTRLGDFGSCDTCNDEDLRALVHDVEAGEMRFMAGRWSTGKGTEAIQPPEVMVPKRRFIILRDLVALYTSQPVVDSVDLTGREFSTSGCAHSANKLAKARELNLLNALTHVELSVDVWACGCLLYEMLTGRMLFGEGRLGRLVVLGTSGAPRESKMMSQNPSCRSHQTPTASSHSVEDDTDTSTALDEWDQRDLKAALGKDVVAFLSKLLSIDPMQRPTASEALSEWRKLMMAL